MTQIRVCRLALLLASATLFIPARNASADQASTWLQVRSPHFVVTSNAPEKSARAVAKQFEEIRAVFYASFPALTSDPGKPLIVLAVKDEGSMKTLLPDYWVAEGGVRPAGLYISSFDEDFIILRADQSGVAENPYRALYHEYAHTVLNQNYRELPAWLSEGLADFFGNTVITGNSVELGHANSAQLRLLQKSALLPLDTLLRVDQHSAQYIQKDPSAVFYAESWALVHYFMLDPEGSKGEPLSRYFKVFDDTGDAVVAAQTAFGDLQELEKKARAYAGQNTFRSERVKSPVMSSEADFAVDQISQSEALAAQADVLQHTRHEKEAEAMLTEALAADPNIASAHTCRGYAAYVHFYDAAAEKEFSEAVKLNPRDFRAHFYLAEVLYREKGFSPETTPQIIEHLERAVTQNEHFAPAFAFLSTAYLQGPETRGKALDAAVKANHLEPTVMAYAINVGNALMVFRRDEEAKGIQEKLSRSARTAQERSMAREFGKRIAHHEELAARHQTDADTLEALAVTPGEIPPDEPLIQPAGGPDAGADWLRVSSEWTETIEGEFREVRSDESSRVNVKFATASEILHLTVPDAGLISYRVKGVESQSGENPALQWKGRKAKLVYRAPAAGEVTPQIVSIDFE